MLHPLSRLKTGFWILTIQSFIATLAFSFDFIYFREQGYSLWWLILIGLLISGISLLIIPFIHTFSVKKYLFTGFCIYGLAALSVVLFQKYALIPYSLLLGLTIIFFWIPINYMFFGSSVKKTNALDSWWYQVPGTLIALVIPLMGLIMIRLGGYPWLFGIGAILFLIAPIVLRNFFPEERIKVDFRQSIQKFKTLKTISMSEGALHFFQGTILHAYALLFIKTSTDYGLFLSFLGLVGFIVALFLAQKSDKTQLRKGIIAGMIFVREAWMWWVLVGAFGIISALSWPLRLAVSMDVKKISLEFWIAWEFFLNVGRVVTLGISMLLFYYELYWAMFAMFGIITITYPLLVHHKLKGLK